LVPGKAASDYIGDLVQKRQVRAQNLAGASIQCEVSVNHTVVELTLVRRLHDDVGLPGWTLSLAAGFGVSGLRQPQLLYIACNFGLTFSVRVPFQYLDSLVTRLRLGEQRGSIGAGVR
jgi:hypothetical protein